MPQEEQLDAAVVGTLERRRVDAHEPADFCRMALCVDLGHVASHRVSRQHRPCRSLALQDGMQPLGQLVKGPVQWKRARKAVGGSVPGNKVGAFRQSVDLEVEYPVVGGDAGKEHQPRQLRAHGCARPIGDAAPCCFKDALLHGGPFWMVRFFAILSKVRTIDAVATIRIV